MGRLLMRYMQSYRAWMGISVGLFLVGLSGCTSFQPKEDPQVVAIQRELLQIEKSNAATQEKIEEIYSQLQALGAKVDGLENSVDELASRPEPQPRLTSAAEPSPSVVEEKLARAPAKIKPAPPKVAAKPAPKPKPKKATGLAKLSPQDQYEKAYLAYAKHRYDEALTLFKNFLQRFPGHELADNAQYWIGEIHYDTKDYPGAIGAFKEVVTRYREKDKAPDAMLKIGYAYVALKDPGKARIFLKRVIEDYPFSTAETKARAKLKELENL